MAGSPNWEGLLKWSLGQSDGTSRPKAMTEEDRKWFTEAMEAQSFDVVKRMKEISLVMKIPLHTLLEQGVTVGELEGLLEELQEHVESIDMANDLKAIGGLEPLLGFLTSSEASLRARAAEVVATVVQNNPKGQSNVLEAGGMEKLMNNFIGDADANARAKALGALSSLIRHNPVGLAAFMETSGMSGLRSALSFQHIRLQRKALHVLLYVLQQERQLKQQVRHNQQLQLQVLSTVALPPVVAAAPSGLRAPPATPSLARVRSLALGPLLVPLLESEDSEVRLAALQVLLELVSEGAEGADGNGAAVPSEEQGSGEIADELEQQLREVLGRRMLAIDGLEGEDLEALQEERDALKQLWVGCFEAPS